MEKQITSGLKLHKNIAFQELSRFSWKNEDDKQFYTRGCLWSPDGSCILTAINLDGMHIYELPADLYQTEIVSGGRSLDILQSVIHVKEGGSVYDYCWYPFMNSSTPETCCWIATRRHEPIHMWDAFNGELRCSFRGYDAVDEVETAISLIFSNDGSKILGGYKKSIKIFDTNIPGRNYNRIDTKQPCSCFALHHSHNELVTTGSWKSTIKLYDLRSPKLGALATLEKHTGGVTHLKFSKSGDSLYSGARKDNQLIEWDMRNFTNPVRILKRNVATNQKVYFDICSSKQWLVSGDTSGLIHVWDTSDNFEEFSFPLHNDCCNGVSIHPVMPVLATTSGQHHFLDKDENDGISYKIYENSLIFWWFGEIS